MRPATVLRALLLPPLQRLALLVAFATGGAPAAPPLRALVRRAAGSAAGSAAGRAVDRAA